MRRFIVPSLTAMMILALTAAAAAEGNNVKAGGGTTVGTTTAPQPVNADGTQSQPSANDPAASAGANTTDEMSASTPDASKGDARQKAIRERAAKMSAKEREAVETKLQANEKDVDVEAVTNGDATVADRFAAEFGVTSEALLAERTQNNVGWGEVMIAHTLLANAPAGTTIDQLYALHADGMGWGQIAYGMGLRVGSFEGAVKTESMIARGTMKPDGKPPKIASSTRVASAAGAHAHAGTAHVGAPTNVTAGASVKVTK